MQPNIAAPDQVVFGYCEECGDNHAILADRNDKSQCASPPKARYGIVILDRWEGTRIIGDADSLREAQTKLNGVLQHVLPDVEAEVARREAHLREIGVASDGNGNALTVSSTAVPE